MSVDRESLLKGFASFFEAKRKQALHSKLFFGASTIIVLCVLYYSYSIVSVAQDKVLVVNTGGNILPMESMELETLYDAGVKSVCYSVSYYANSFDVNNIKNNQASAAFLVNQADLNAVIDKYQYDKAYSDAINKGVVYRCMFEKINLLKRVGNGSRYEVVFTSILSIISNVETKYIQIVSKATAIRTTARFPENPTGFYFISYVQEYYPINN